MVIFFFILLFFFFCLKRLLKLPWVSELESVMGTKFERGSRNFKETSLWKEFSNLWQGGNSSWTNAGGDNSSEQFFSYYWIENRANQEKKTGEVCVEQD